MPSTLTKMQPNLYQYITISRSKNKEYILKVSEYGKRIHATVKLPPLRVIRAQLDVDGNGFGHHTVTLERPPWVKEFCDKAMRLAFKDTRLWPELDRIDEESFVQGAAHSLLRNGLFLKKRMWGKKDGKMTQPKFRNPRRNLCQKPGIQRVAPDPCAQIVGQEKPGRHQAHCR